MEGTKQSPETRGTAAHRVPGGAPRPKVALIGFMGSGKSAVGEKLARRLGVEWYDTDAILAQETGMAIPEYIQARGEGAFRALEGACLARLASLDSGVVSCGGGAILSAENRRLLREAFYTVWLSVSAETVIARSSRGSSPLLDCEDPLGRARLLLARREKLYVEASSYYLSTDDKNPDQIAEILHDSMHQA